MTTNPKNPWQHYVHIDGIDWIYAGELTYHFIHTLPKYGLEKSSEEALCVISKYNCEFYFKRAQFREAQQLLVDRVVQDPQWGLNFNARLNQSNESYFKIAREIELQDLSALSNEALIKLWEKLCADKEKSHTLGVVTTWMIDAYDQLFTEKIISIFNKVIKESNLDIDINEAFTTLTTPLEKSYISEEETELLKLFSKYKLKKDDKSFKQEIERFANDYGWLYYKYLGPSKTAMDYLRQLQEMDKEDIDPEAELAKISQNKEKIKTNQQSLYNKLNLDDKTKDLISFARQIVFMKDQRKAGQFYGCYIKDKILSEVARRLSLTLTQVRNFLPQEISPALLERKFDAKKLDDRHALALRYSSKDDDQFLSGPEAEKFLHNQQFTTIDTDIKELKGACACVGRSKGTVRIINVPEEMNKMSQGDIMVAHATFPGLVPAMKKASAIVTDEGGLACHAAIVSRELGVPCIVGTKIATKILKDGDIVEVDANKGEVKILTKG